MQAQVDVDFPTETLRVLRDILDQAYRDVRRIVDPEREPGFRTPNLATIRGQVRWAIVETIAMEACRSGRLGKLTAAWVRGSDGPVQPPTPSPP